MIHPAKTPRSRSGRIAITIAAVVAAFAMILPQLGIASAAPGDKYNTSEKCEGQYADKDTKLVAFKRFDFYVDGVKTSTEYREVSKLLKPGADVKIVFELKPQCDNTFVGIDVYALPSDGFKRSEASQQRLIKRVGKAFDAGRVHTLTNTLPECWFQMDVYTGWEYKPGDYTLDKRGRLLLAGIGGSEKCERKQATTTTQRPVTTTTTTAPTTTTSTTPAPTTTTSTTVVQEERRPSATVRQVCDEDGSGWTTTFRNRGDVTERFVVKRGDDRLDAVTVKPGESTSRTYSFADEGIEAGESARVSVEANGRNVATETITNDCVEVTASAAAACDTAAGSGAVLTFSNTGEVDEVFTVKRDGTEVSGSPINVPAGRTEQRSLLSMSEDEKATLVITGERSGLRVERTVTLDCEEVAATTSTTSPETTLPAEVLGETVERPQLAETGFSPVGYAAGAFMLLAVGVSLLRAARRLRFSH